MSGFSLARTAAVFIKEFQQMLRDRLTFAMAVFIPVLQLVLFGYAINTDPKNLPAAVVAQDSGAAITGAVRVDLFFGWGREAEARAGRMKQPLRLWALWPK